MSDSDAVCASCMRPLMPCVMLCFDCDLDSDTPPAASRSSQRVKIRGHARDPARLAATLLALVRGLSAARAAVLAHGAALDLVGDLTPSQTTWLTSALDACGAPVATFAFEETRSAVHFELDTKGWVKLGVTATVGAAAYYVAVPLVPYAAIAVVLILAARGVRWDAREVTIDCALADKLLAPVDSRVIERLRFARRSASDPRLRSRLELFASRLIELSATYRHSCEHLSAPEDRRADTALVTVAGQVTRLLSAAQRRSAAQAPGAAYRSVACSQDSALGCLDRLTMDVEGCLTGPAPTPEVLQQLATRIENDVRATTAEPSAEPRTPPAPPGAGDVPPPAS